jgi:glycosyltransferase involved in cell wall biosynthesis
MACGRPMIATDHSGGPDVIDDGVHGFIVPIRDVGALKERFRHLYHHRREAHAMGVRGRERMVSMFTWNHYGQRVAEAYQTVIAARQREMA